MTNTNINASKPVPGPNIERIFGELNRKMQRVVALKSRKCELPILLMSDLEGHFARLNCKVERIVTFESLTCELPMLLLSDNPPDLGESNVLEYWEASQVIKVSIDDRKGRRRAFSYMADFVLLRSDRVEFVECRPEACLLEAARKHPGLFVKLGGSWQCPPVEEALAKWGIGFAFWQPASTPTMREGVGG